MRTSILVGLAALCAASVARADDTKPPQISDVRAGVRGNQVQVEARITDETGVLSAICHHRTPGGRVEASPMMKSDLDDTFRVSFPGNPQSEYWIEASDLLGNGPATWGSSSKAYAVGGKAAPGKPVASAEPPAPKQEPKRARKTPPPARASQPPAIQYIRPAEPPAAGNPFTMRTRIQSDSPVAVAVLQARAQGTAAFVNLPLTKAEGDTWQAQIPAPMAHGIIEYFIAAKNQAGQMTRQGESEGKPYGLTFKSAAPTASAPAAMT